MKGNKIIFINVPNKINIGIDYYTYQVTEKFKGYKNIKKGVHYLYYNMENEPPVSFFEVFEENEIKILEWIKEEEEFKYVENEKKNEIIRKIEYNDQEFLNLLDYPFEKYDEWIKLSRYITKEVVERISPLNKFIFPINLTHEEEEKLNNEILKKEKELNKEVQEKELNEEEINLKEKEEVQEKELNDEEINFKETEKIQEKELNEEINLKEKKEKNYKIYFTKIPRLLKKKGINGAEITRLNLDKTELIQQLIKDNFQKEFKNMMAEFQISYLCFLIGQNYTGFEQWKSFLDLLCNSEQYWKANKKELIKFLNIFYFQLLTIPEDFFFNEFTSSNFLNKLLKNFTQDLLEFDDENILLEGNKFKSYLEKKFNVKFDDLLDEDELPVIVDEY
jgi:A1 cistron-splicing factor AAR2